MTTPELAQVPVRSTDDLTGRCRVLPQPPTSGHGAHLAMALCRPGTAAVGDSDAWVTAPSEAFDDLARR